MLKKNEKKKYGKQPNGNVYNWLISCYVILNLQLGKKYIFFTECMLCHEKLEIKEKQDGYVIRTLI